MSVLLFVVVVFCFCVFGPGLEPVQGSSWPGPPIRTFRSSCRVSNFLLRDPEQVDPSSRRGPEPQTEPTHHQTGLWVQLAELSDWSEVGQCVNSKPPTWTEPQDFLLSIISVESGRGGNESRRWFKVWGDTEEGGVWSDPNKASWVQRAEDPLQE